MLYNVNNNDICIRLCNKPVRTVHSETYLGNIISSDIFDRSILQSIYSFNTKSNHIIAGFSMLDCFSLHKLHSIYCMSLYGCELWNYNSKYVNDIFIAWRKVMRKLFRLPYRTHNYIICGVVECITVKLDRRLCKFIHSMLNSNNMTVKELLRHFMNCDSSVIAENVRYIMHKYDISVFLWYGDLSSIISKIKINRKEFSDYQLSNIETIRELCNVRDGIILVILI